MAEDHNTKCYLENNTEKELTEEEEEVKISMRKQADKL